MIAGVARPRGHGVQLSLRKASRRDRHRVLRWNNAPDVRARSLDRRPIDPADHARWFERRLEDPLTHMWIIEHEHRPIGVVRIQRLQAGAPGLISIVIDAAARGRGVGRDAIVAACRLDGGPVIAEIVPENAQSLACFTRAGFAPVAAFDGLDAPEVASSTPPRPGVHRLVWRRAHV